MMLPEDRGAIEALWIDHWYVYPSEKLGEFEVCCQSSDERITDVGIYDGVEIVDQLLSRGALFRRLIVTLFRPESFDLRRNNVTFLILLGSQNSHYPGRN